MAIENWDIKEYEEVVDASDPNPAAHGVGFTGC